MIGHRRAVGIDIGGTKISAAVVDSGGRHTAPVVRPTPAGDGPEAILTAAIDVAQRALDSASGDVHACGVGTAGTVDPAGVISVATDLLAGWAGTDVRTSIGAALGLPTSVLNDVHAAGLAEAVHGAARDVPHALVIAVGTGIGGAVTSHGQVLAGRHGQAGSVGHVLARRLDGRRCSCGVPDHIEAYASGPGIERTYRDATGLDLGLREVAHRAGHGDEVARDVIADAGHLLGRAIGSAIRIVDPGIVVIGGGVAGLGEALLVPLRAGVEDEMAGAPACPVVPARFAGTATLVGAAVTALGAGPPRSTPPGSDTAAHSSPTHR